MILSFGVRRHRTVLKVNLKLWYTKGVTFTGGLYMNLRSVKVPPISWHTLYPVQAQWLNRLWGRWSYWLINITLRSFCGINVPIARHIAICFWLVHSEKLTKCFDANVFNSSTQTTYPGQNADFVTRTRLDGIYSLLFETWLCIRDSEGSAYGGLAGAMLEMWEFYIILGVRKAGCVCGMWIKLADDGV